MRQTLRFPSADRGRRQASLLDRERVERTYPGGGFHYIKPSELGRVSDHIGVALDRAAPAFDELTRNDRDGIVRLGYSAENASFMDTGQQQSPHGIREKLKLGRALRDLGVAALQKLATPRSRR